MARKADTNQSVLSPRVTASGYKENSATLLLLIFLSLWSAFYYLSFLFNKQHIGDPLPYAIVIISEVFIIFQALVRTWTIIVGDRDPRDFVYKKAHSELLQLVRHSQQPQPALRLNDRVVSIDVFIPTYGEPLSVIKRTVEAAQAMIGKHQTYILDDGRQDQIKELAKVLGVRYLTRETSKGAKAGNLNHALSQTDADFFVVFDADHIPKKNFLVETLPFFIEPHVAFVQTPQYFTNLHNVIARGSGFAQRIFYELVQHGKNRFNAAFCVGTNVIFRRSAIEAIGGIYDQSHSEDIWTSLRLHQLGFRSVYISNILAEGKAPDTVKAHLKQQLRWATGAFEIFFRANPLFLKGLTIDQKIQYLSTSIFYFNGLVLLLLMLLPTINIFFGQVPIVSSEGLADWFAHYFVFYALQIVIEIYLMQGFRWETLVVSMIAFPVYIRALVNVVFRKTERWNITGQVSNHPENPFNYITTQILVFLFLLIATLISLFDVYHLGDLFLAIVWNALNILIFGTFIVIAYQEYKATPPLEPQRLKLEDKSVAESQYSYEYSE